MTNSPGRIGITGGIGTGKTTVAEVFNMLKVPVYNADDRAKWLMQHDSELTQKIIAAFGEKTFLDGVLNRQYLAEKVFGNADLVQQLNALVHPAVAKDFGLWSKQQNTSYVLKEAALLFETGSYQELDATILVLSPLQLRIDRIKKRDPQRSVKQIENIIAKQIDIEEARNLADYVILNDESAMIIPQVLEIHQILQRKKG